MAASNRSTCRLLAALMLLITVPAAGSIPALPPPAPKANLVSADLLDDVAGPERPEILVLVGFVVPEETVAEGYPHQETRVWGSKLHGEMPKSVPGIFRGRPASVGLGERSPLSEYPQTPRLSTKLGAHDGRDHPIGFETAETALFGRSSTLRGWYSVAKCRSAS
ncbi:MAG: hypothetical protein K8J08_10695 [Thermoanaerobaculia bacterium]|nr:hypothetical protein [Thermoanaerobaculia bacterium]